jgi:hypothetical protein
MYSDAKESVASFAAVARRMIATYGELCFLMYQAERVAGCH